MPDPPDKRVGESERDIISLAGIFTTCLGAARDNGKVTKSTNLDVVDFSFPYTIRAGVELPQDIVASGNAAVGTRRSPFRGE